MDKLKAEMTQEEKLEFLKDEKVKNILHNSLDAIMSNRVIACKSSKEIWDKLEFQCQRTKQLKRIEEHFLFTIMKGMGQILMKILRVRTIDFLHY